MSLKWSGLLGGVVFQAIFEGKKGKLSRSWGLGNGNIMKFCLNKFFLRS